MTTDVMATCIKRRQISLGRKEKDFPCAPKASQWPQREELLSSGIQEKDVSIAVK